MNTVKQISPDDRVLVVAHDAGGAAFLAAWISRELDYTHCDFLLQGPAEKIFPQYLNLLSTIEKQQLAIEKYSLVLTSTSSRHSDLEVSVIHEAKKNGIYTIAMLDYWRNYQERFYLKDQIVLPDEIWVCDEYAEEISRSELPGVPVFQKENYYFSIEGQKILDKSAGELPTSYLRVLYLCEPSLHVSYSEFDVLKETLHYLSSEATKDNREMQVRLRLHPREESGKYNCVVNKEYPGLDLKISFNTELSDDIAWSQVVIGAQTTSMVVALESNRTVYSSAPCTIENIALPHSEISRIFPYQATKNIEQERGVND